MHRFRRPVHLLALITVLASLMASVPASQAAPIATDPFQRTWQRTDKPVADGSVQRTWMWGPEPFTEARTEAYAGAPGETRTVQYFDKSRMEDNSYRGSAPWDVTNGLLVVEMMSGQMQVGDDQFETRAPAQINVAGDPGDPLTYAVLAGLRGNAPLTTGTTITQRLDASGQITEDPDLVQYGAIAVGLVPETNHTVASPFWEFMTASGLVYENGGTTHAPLFEDPYYATGLPITEAYWADVTVGGTQREVLLQCFERRCLTYTPGNPAEWQVEAGNVGQHYYKWRYPDAEAGPNAQANALAAAVTNAPDDAARKQALMDVFKAINLGVYAGDGTMLLGGAERSAEDFYLYELEVEMLAGAIGRGQTFGIVDLAMQLTAMELLPEGQVFDPEVVRQALLQGIASAQADPNGFTSLSPLIVRQLGLTQMQPYDLFEDVPLETIRMDALSFFLVLADIAVPLIAGQDVEAGATSNMIANSNGILTYAGPTALAACDPPTMFQGDAFKDAYGWTKISAELMQLVPNAVGRVTVVLDALHGAILAFSVGVTELDQRLQTHYGHESPGEPITFRVKVEMRDDVSKALIECGWIAGTTFPPKGPIAGVSVHWFWDDLENHGTIDCGNACPGFGGNGLSIDATGADGIAKMTFRPKTEEKPGEGWVVEEQGVVTGVALYQSKFTNLLGSYGQYLTPKSGATRWVVERHEQPGWDVEMTLDYDIDTDWKHIGYDAAADYFLETADGNGELTFTFHIPMAAVDAEGDYSVPVKSDGSISVHQTSTDHSEYEAYYHWEFDCTATHQGKWDSYFLMGDIYSDTSGNRTVMPKMMLPPYMAMDKWKVSGWHGAGEGHTCDPIVYGDMAVLGSLLNNVPSFSLDHVGEQTLHANSAAVCSMIRETILMKWNTIPAQPGVQQTCSIDAEWTVKVEWAGQPGW